MQRIALLLAVVAVIGCRPETAYQGDSNSVSLADYEIGEPVTHGNLTIFTITSKVPLDKDRFITLDEGLKAGTVKVFEMGAENGADQLPNLNDDSNAPNATPNLDVLPNPTEENASDDVDDPRAALPAPPMVEDSATVAEQPVADDPFDDSPTQQLLAQTEMQVAYDTLDAGNLQFNQGDFDLQFTQGGGREVNRLMVVNNSDRPLYLMPGEVIIGGSQDRTIGQELVIAPGGDPVAVDVFCVEQERWNDRSVTETVAQLEVASQGALGGSITVAGDANANDAAQDIAQGEFIASVGNLSKGARLALQKSGEQSQVWDEVAKQNATSKVAGNSATFSANYSNAEFNDRLNPYVEALHDPVAKHENVVGVIVAVNGKVESMDMFESTPLFQKLWPKLLKSYALDAATHSASHEAGDGAAIDKAPAVPTLTVADARTFFTKATRGEVTKSDARGDLVAVTQESDDVICFSSRHAGAASPAEPADASYEVGGFGGGVHTNAFAH